MPDILGNTKAVVAIGLVVLVMVGILGAWRAQANRMADDFVRAVRADKVGTIPVTLTNKTWTDAELSEVEVIKLDSATGTPRSLERRIHTGGGFTVSAQQYAYQATLTDSDTGIKHVFGYQRRPEGWRYVTVHPDSAAAHIQQRVQDAERIYDQYR